MRNAIFTGCSIKYGDFLADHWYRSLKDNVDLSNIDVIILDYGLSETKKSKVNRCNNCSMQKRYAHCKRKIKGYCRILKAP